MGAVVVLLSLLAAGPVIHADADGCPEAAAVSERLAGLLDGGADPAAPDRVDLAIDGSDLRLRLSRADGTLVAERRIPRSNRCPELADAVAALVAAWESDLRPMGPTTVIPSPPRTMAPALVEEVTPEPSRTIYELGVVPALWLGGGRPSFASSLRAGVWSRRSPVGATVAFSATFPLEGPSSDGWRRHALSAGVMGRLRHSWLFVDGLGEMVLGWLVVNEQGSGTRAQFDPGLTIGVRAGSRVARRLELYLSVGAWGAAWSSARQSSPGAVPHWGLLTGLGGSFLFGT
jgi:hypothetical protein